MVPADVVILDELPYLDSGKADRKALRAIYDDQKSVHNGGSANTNPQLEKIIAVVNRTLNTAVDPRTQLSTVGLDSLTAIRLALELHKAGFARPDATDLLTSSTASDIEAILHGFERDRNGLESLQEDSTDFTAVRRAALSRAKVEQIEVDDVFPATSVQAAMISRTMQESQAYCNYVELEISYPVSFPKLSRSLQDLARQHSVLRSGFVATDLSISPYAMVVWKGMQPSQIRQVQEVSTSFTIANEAELLRPCIFQLVISEDQARIGMQIHHALYDQWAVDLLCADLGILLKQGRLIQQPSFRNVAAGYWMYQRSSAVKSDLEFWHGYLQDITPSRLPALTDKVVARSLNRLAWEPLDIDLTSVKERSRAAGYSAATVFQSAMSYLLASLVGSMDITYGVVYSGRHLRIDHIDSVFGPCLNTLPLRIDLSTIRTCSDLLRLVHTTNQNVQRHSMTSLAEILARADSLQDMAIFDTLFVWQESTVEDVQSIVKETESIDHHEYSLVVELRPVKGKIDAKATYREDLITAPQVQVFLKQLGVLAEGIVSRQNSDVEELGMQLPIDLLSISNPLPTSAADGQRLIDPLRSLARSNPTAPAIVFANEIGGNHSPFELLSYDDLNAQSEAFAAQLQCHGVLPGELVCICMEKSARLYVTIIGTLKAGAGYLPITPETPQERIHSILNQSKCKVCICDDYTAVHFAPRHDVCVLDVTKMDLRNRNPNFSEQPLHPHYIAYTVFTSGSTGEPKGVAVTVGNLLGNLQVLNDLYKPSTGDRLLQACSHAFDVSVFEIFFAFYTGMCLCSARKDSLFRDLEDSIRQLQISHLSLTPTVAALVDPTNVPSVKFLVTAGEAITGHVHRKWAGRGLHQGYGPSETTNICTINMNMSQNHSLGNIGRPFRNTSAFVISPDDGFKILPAGAFGEFAFGGEQVFQGYVGREELNAAKIIDHPQYGRVYRSGDMGRILHGGTLIITGRLDDQIKIRGNRIELGEINAIALQDPWVRDCTTILTGDSASQQHLVLFVVPTSAASKSDEPLPVEADQHNASRLFSLFESSLPLYMMPSNVVPITHLPRTSQGKLDRRRLQTLVADIDQSKAWKLSSSAATDNTAKEAWSPLEHHIAEALAAILDVPMTNIARNASFFALGLNSLNAIAFTKRLSKDLHLNLSVSDALRYSTIAKLADIAERKRVPDGTNGIYSPGGLLPNELVRHVLTSGELDERAVRSVLPCTPLQNAMLSAGSMGEESSYCNKTVFRITGAISKLVRCWETMVERHAILRTRFVSTDSKEYPYLQVVFKQSPRCIMQYQNSNSGESKIDVASSINQSNPLRIVVTDTGSQATLSLFMHHAIYDGLSMSILLKEIESQYHSKTLPQPIQLEPFLAEMQQHQSHQAHTFWASKFSNYVAKPFPKSHEQRKCLETTVRSQVTTGQVAVLSYCKRHAVSPLAVFQAALAKCLAHCQEEDDVCFGNVVSGRAAQVDGVDSLVAPCFNTIPVRAEVRKTRSNIDLVRLLNDYNIDSTSFQLTALRKIQSLSKTPERHLFDALLLLQPAPVELEPAIWELEEEVGTMDIPVVFELTPVGDEYDVLLHFRPSHLAEELARILLDVFLDAFESVVNSANASVGHFGNGDISFSRGMLATKEAPNDESSTTIENSNSPQEDIIREIFAKLAGVNKTAVGRSTSMYQVGLDSLNAAQVSAKLRASGIDVDAADVMEALTPEALAALVARKVSQRVNTRQPPVEFDSFDDCYRSTVLQQSRLHARRLECVRPCTPVQCGMVAQSINSDGKLYVNHITFNLPLSVQSSELKDAWLAVAKRHQMLRAGLLEVAATDSSFAMAIWSPNDTNVPFIEPQSCLSLAEIEATATKTIMNSFSTQPWQVAFQSQRLRNFMVLTIHHALYDANSLQLILSDLSKALLSKHLKPAPSIDDALSTILSTERNGRQESEKFWSDNLHDSNISPFPSLTPSVVRRGTLDTLCHKLKSPISRLDGFCRKQNVTIQALGQTVWAMLLASYTGDSTVMFGVVLADHSISSEHSAAFPSISTIPVICNTEGSPSNIVRQMLKFNTGAHRYRFMPLVDIQRCSGHPGEQLFDTVFVYQKSLFTSGVDWPIIRETASVEYALSMELESGSHDSLDLQLTFDDSRIPREHAQLLLHQFEHVVDTIVGQSPNTYPDLHSIIPAKEPTLPSPSNSLHGLVSETVKRCPNQVALEFVVQDSGDSHSVSKWTYQDLNERADQVVTLLQSSGVRPGDTVAVCMEKCPEASFAFYGILKAGCAFLAMDPDLPEARHRFILQDSKTKLVLVGTNTMPEVVSSMILTVQIREDLLQKLPLARANQQGSSGSDTCYCLYTSGTTGTPKGCEITHENAVQAMMAFQRLFSGRWTDSSRWLQFASYWFDVSVLEQFWSWSVGITVVGAPRDVILGDIPGFIGTFGITHIDLTPSLARLVHPADVPSLWGGVFITGGEALKQEIIDEWGPKSTICNGYGPTEATIGVTMNRFIGSNAKPSNIGPQFDNVGTYVLDPEGDQPVLKGAVGELCVSGKLVGKGYLHRPDITATSFPFLSRFKERVYRTGDLVRMLADGSFTFIGRKDSQTKLRGQRLELGEIDKVLLKSGGNVAHALSLVVKADDRSKETLVSFFTVNSGTESKDLVIDKSEQGAALARRLREGCIGQLPGYMVPTHVIPIDFLPLTVNNKVDSKRLVSLYHTCSTQDLQNLQPNDTSTRTLNAAEKTIAKELGNLLGVDVGELTPQSNTFSLGLSSISAIPFVSSLKRNGFSSADVATILSNSTLERLSNALAKRNHRSIDQDNSVRQAKLSLSAFHKRYLRTASQALSVNPAEIEIVAPCTPLQQGLILESHRQEQRPYFNHFHYRVNVQPTSKVIEAFQRLVDESQILRATFIETHDGFAQVILKKSKLSAQKLSGKTSSMETSLHRTKQEWIERNGSNLTVPFEVVLFETPDHSHLAVYIHHALYDGISFDMMLEKVAELCSGETNVDFGPAFVDALPHGPLRQVNGQSFWKTQLQDVDPNWSIPRGSRSKTSDHMTASLRLTQTNGVEQTRKKLGVSHQSVIQACFEIALRRHVESLQMYGMIVSGRSIEFDAPDRVLGPMFNTLPQSLALSADSTISDHVRQCHDHNIQMLPYQHVPLRDIQKWCGFHSPGSLFDVLFVFQHNSHIAGQPLPTALTPLPIEPHAEYPLAWEAELHKDGSLEVSLLAQSRCFGREQLDGLLATFKAAMNSLESRRTLAEQFDLPANPTTPRTQSKLEQNTQMNGVHGFEWTHQSKTIRSAIATVAKVDINNIDEHTTLFALGLDSIDSVKLSSRLRDAGFKLPVSQVLRAQTIPRMLAALDKSEPQRHLCKGEHTLKRLEKNLQAEFPSLQHSQRIERILPATPQQEGLVGDMLRTELHEYFNHDVVHLRPETEISRLKTAWNMVINGSPILRTVFTQVDSLELSVSFAQAVQREYHPKFQQYKRDSIDELPDVFDDVRLDVLKDINMLPPLRISFLRTRQKDYMILSISHALYDGQSLTLLHEDLRRAYEDTYSLRPSYDSVIESAMNAQSQSAERFWAGMFSGTTRAPFPTIAGAAEPSLVLHREVKSNTSAETVRQFCRNENISMQAFAETCWALTLAHYTQHTEVVFGVVLACRDSVDAQEVMFPTMNTVAMHSSLHGTRVEMLQYMQSLVTEVQQYQRTPLRAIKAALSDKQFGSLFDTLFIYQKTPTPRTSLRAPLYDSVSGSSDIEYPVAVELEDTTDAIILRAACKSTVCDHEETQNLLIVMDRVLNSILSAPSEPTVAFDEQLVSICGLEGFVPDAHILPSDGIEEASAPGHVGPEPTSTLLPQVLEVLAKVAKVSADELHPGSTIESIGVDSISSIKVVALLKKRDIHITVSALLRARTAGRIAETASPGVFRNDQEYGALDSDAIINGLVQPFHPDQILDQLGIVPDDVETVIPATSGQIYMLQAWKKSGGQVFYPTFKYMIVSAVNLDRIKKAWKAVVARHGILRTVFFTTQNDRTPVAQAVLRHHPEGSHGFIDGFENKGRDCQPMVSFRAAQLGDRWQVHLKMHHALYDAVSLPLIIQDLKSYLESADLPANASNGKKLRLHDYIAASMSYQAREGRKRHYSQYLKDIMPCQLLQPLKDGQQMRVNLFRPSVLIVADALETFARKQRLSLQALFFAAYAKAYAALTSSTEQHIAPSGSKDVLLGIYMSNRAHVSGSESLPAPLVNIVPLVVRSAEQRELLDAARAVQADLNEIGSMENSAISMHELKSWAGQTVDTIVNFLKTPETEVSDDEAKANILNAGNSNLEGYEKIEGPDTETGELAIPDELKLLQSVDEAYKVSLRLRNAIFNLDANLFKHTVDIELAITKEGKLDVGLFCPEAMLSLSKASSLVDNFTKVLLTGVVEQKE